MERIEEVNSCVEISEDSFVIEAKMIDYSNAELIENKSLS